METVNNLASAASKAIWGEPASSKDNVAPTTEHHEEPVSGELGNVSAGEPYDAGNLGSTETEKTVPSGAAADSTKATEVPSTAAHTSTPATAGLESTTTAIKPMSDAEAASKLSADKPITSEPSKAAETGASTDPFTSKVDTKKETSKIGKFTDPFASSKKEETSKTGALADPFTSNVETKKEDTPKTNGLASESKKDETTGVGIADRGGAVIPGASTAKAAESGREPAGVTETKPLVDRSKVPPITDRNEKEMEKGIDSKTSTNSTMSPTSETKSKTSEGSPTRKEGEKPSLKEKLKGGSDKLKDKLHMHKKST
ncbi:hypothetical protein BP5796_00519 [Coleophoma crateriformis]|uniref:Uncharacterized protein n=1 Tax=Coleophoma crateriformis TaxID=565419 RepID=A0A3D8T885_9HELO|nr:hypothetical protein BP5796_00519 [Coleophoma crateriformis]